MPSPKDPIKRSEWIKKFSDKLRGKPKSEEHRRKMSEAHKNISDETRRKNSEAFKGKPLSEEHRSRVGEGQRGKVLSEDFHGQVRTESIHVCFSRDQFHYLFKFFCFSLQSG